MRFCCGSAWRRRRVSCWSNRTAFCRSDANAATWVLGDGGKAWGRGEVKGVDGDGVAPGGFDGPRDLGQGLEGGGGEEVALHEGDAAAEEDVDLGAGLYALADDLDAEAVGHGGGGADDLFGARLGIDAADEAAV